MHIQEDLPRGRFVREGNGAAKIMAEEHGNPKQDFSISLRDLQ